ncbi:MAG TPA: hypothetical protein DEX10_00475 [Betaproteobacteria bacterium]|nr:hypothetical protein [Betaproteobacteria bacterium]
MRQARKSDLEIFRNEDAATKLAALRCVHSTRRIQLLLLTIALAIACFFGAEPLPALMRWF